MNAWLQSKDGGRLEFAGSCSIGRLPDNLLVLDDPAVSRRHAIIHAHGESGYWLVDFGSRNGVALNGRRITKPVRLANGDGLEIAGHRLVFHERREKQAGARGAKSAVWQTTESLSETFVPVGHGMILLTPEGKVQSISGHAQEWLETYFARNAPGSDALPGELRKWLDRSLDPSSRKGTPPATKPSDVFSIEKNRKRLAVRIAEESPEQLLLLLTESETIFSAALLRQLGLTEREGEVLHWLAEGKSNPEIAIILDVSPRTVGKHVEHIFGKLGVESRAAAMLHVMEVLGKF